MSKKSVTSLSPAAQRRSWTKPTLSHLAAGKAELTVGTIFDGANHS
jgi:hypothetical protein